MMNNVDVTFDIPSWIQEGLNTGKYIRYGGVIRNPNDKQIVAFLRENVTKLDANLLSLSNIGSITSILNLVVTVVGFILVLKKLNVIENLIYQLHQEILLIDRKIDIGFYSELKTGLELLYQISFLTNSNNRQNLSAIALEKLTKSKNIFQDYCELYSTVSDLYNVNPQDDNENVKRHFDVAAIKIEKSIDFLNLVNLAHYAIVVCYLEMNEYEVATKYLENELEQIKLNCKKNRIDYTQSPINSNTTTSSFSPLYSFFSDREKIQKNREMIESHKKLVSTIFKTHKNILLKHLERMTEFKCEVDFIQQKQLTWAEWKELKPQQVNSEAEFMLIIPQTS